MSEPPPAIMYDHPNSEYEDEAEGDSVRTRGTTKGASQNKEGGKTAGKNDAKRDVSNAANDKGSDDPNVSFFNDPRFDKQDWNVDDWRVMYDKMPPNTCSNNYSYLMDYADQILVKEPMRVFLPLCGSTNDLRWLYNRGNTVVGLDAIEHPVLQFFKQNSDLEHTVEDLPSGKIYKSKDQRLQVFVCDVIEVDPKILGKFDAVVDCGAYVAIHPSDRSKYVELVTGVLEKDYRYFLEVCHDAPPGSTGLPHSIPFSSVKKDFGPSMQLRFLQTEDISEEWSVESFFQTLILLSPQLKKKKKKKAMIEEVPSDPSSSKALKSSKQE